MYKFHAYPTPACWPSATRFQTDLDRNKARPLCECVGLPESETILAYAARVPLTNKHTRTHIVDGVSQVACTGWVIQ